MRWTIVAVALALFAAGIIPAAPEGALRFDTAEYAARRDMPKNLPFKPGHVFAADIYAVFPGDNLGVRVENTVLITETGCENLTPGIPREISEIEALMGKNAAGKSAKK
jgi:hypothetical protein